MGIKLIGNNSSLSLAGSAYIKGDTGASAYDIAIANGFEGTEKEWLASLKGDKGDTGADGAKGDKGDIAPVYVLSGRIQHTTNGACMVTLYKDGEQCTERVYLKSYVASGTNAFRVHSSSTGYFTSTKSWSFGGNTEGIAWYCEAYTDDTCTELLASCALNAGAKGDDGEAGAAGYTPIKTVDYWTEEDKAEMVQDVLAALPDGEGVSY